MSEYFSGKERLGIFTTTGMPMRMGELSQLNIPDYQVLKGLVKEKKWDEAVVYFKTFHAQNMGMLNLGFEWCVTMPKYYAELTSVESEENLRPHAISDYQKIVDKMRLSYEDKDDLAFINQMMTFFTTDNLLTIKPEILWAEMDDSSKKLNEALINKNEKDSLKLITSYHHQAVIRHDSFITFIYSYPTTVMGMSGEKMGIEIGNGSMLKNAVWNGLWELAKVFSPNDLAAFLAEHLRFHFSGADREGQATIIEDDQKIRLILDPCGSGGALRMRLGNEIKNFQEKHDLGWNKCKEVNLYCSHCALNEKHSIALFGYPKFVVEFQPDANKPCGWTVYKNKDDVPQEVYERLGFLKKPIG